MGLELRGGGMYFYRKERRNGRPVSFYCGSVGTDFGRLSYSIARLDRERREQEAADRARELAPIAELRAQEGAARELERQARDLAALVLLAAGYHRHKGTWRKRRGDAMKRTEKAEKVAELPPLPAPGDDSAAARLAIMKRCDRPDASAEDLAALRRLLDHAPHIVESLGNPMRNALERAATITQGTPLWSTSAEAYLSGRRKALGYDTAPALERPLIDHLLLCEVRMAHVEMRYTRAWGDSMAWTSAEHWERLMTATQRRYLAAVETLAKVRRVRVEAARVLPDGSAEAVAVESPGA